MYQNKNVPSVASKAGSNGVCIAFLAHLRHFEKTLARADFAPTPFG